MSQDNRQSYGPPPTGGQYQNNMQQPYQNQLNQYGQHEAQNTAMDPNQPPQNYPQQTQNQSNIPTSAYPSLQPGSYDKGQQNLGYAGYPPQNNSNFPQGIASQPPSQQPNFSNPSVTRSEAPNQNYPAQPQYPGAPGGERHQNTFSQHETSAPVGAMNQQNFVNQRQEMGARQDQNFMGNQPSSNFRGEGASSQNYGQPPAPDFNRPSQITQQPIAGGDPSSQILGGFLGQSQNQPSAQVPGSQYNQPQEMPRGGTQEPAPGFQFNAELGGAGGNPALGGSTGAPPMGMSMNSTAADPQSMDIGALNRMAEYYATNSDYPKASSLINFIGY